MKEVIIPLPQYGYQDNPDVTALLSPFEAALRDCVVISDWLATPKLTYPALEILGIKFSKLDYLASLLGFYGYFWRDDWTDVQKWNLIKNAFYLWENRGTNSALQKVLTILDLPFSIWTLHGGFIVDLSKLDIDVLGEHNPFFAYLLLPLTISRVTQWGNYRYILERFVPVCTSVTLCYDQFYCDYSVLGEPILS